MRVRDRSDLCPAPGGSDHVCGKQRAREFRIVFAIDPNLQVPSTDEFTRTSARSVVNSLKQPFAAGSNNSSVTRPNQVRL